jgi:RNA polymerase sigma-70 factor (ECF subfamily)
MEPDFASAQASPEFAARLTAARAGCRESLGKLLEDLRPYLRWVAERCPTVPLGRGSWLDVVQETNLSALRGFARFRGGTEAELRAWSRRILVHILANYAVERARRPGPLPASEEQADVKTPLWLALELEKVTQIKFATAQLSAEHQEVLALRRGEVLTWEEVGSRLGKSAEAARKLHSRAIRELGDLVEPYWKTK